MQKNTFARIVCSLLVEFVLLLTACGGASATPSLREQSLVTEVAALQTQLAMTIVPSAPTRMALTPTPTLDAIATRLDQYIQGQSGFSGAVLVAQKGKVLLEKGYGLADRQNDVPNTPQSKFAIGSMTKAFTAMSIMILQERGKLSVQDPICNYIKDCPATWKAITLHHLLTHTSGIPNYTNFFDKFHMCEAYTPDDVVAKFKDLPLDFAPGDHWSYSNSGYFLLGMVIEKVSGGSYENFIQENIFKPLGMADTGYDRASTIVKNRAVGYSFDPTSKQPVNIICIDVSLKFAAGALYSTVGDLYKWDQSLYTDQLVSKETLNTIFTSTVVVPVGGMGMFPDGGMYGYGWVIAQPAGHRTFEHVGSVPGFLTYFVRYPDDQLTVIVLPNVDNLDTASINRGLAAIALGIK